MKLDDGLLKQRACHLHCCLTGLKMEEEGGGHGYRSISEFECLGLIGEGSFGTVHKAKDVVSGEIVAVKKEKPNGEDFGISKNMLSEIDFLSLCKGDPCIIQLKDIVMASDLESIYLVMEYAECDLKHYLAAAPDDLSEQEVKNLMQQFLRGIFHLHSRGIIHRDLKTSNILMMSAGQLKIGDLGLCRRSSDVSYPTYSVFGTLHYRAPELLLGAKFYTAAIDMWSTGCVMAELLLKKVLFPGKDQLHQLSRILRALPSFHQLPCKFPRRLELGGRELSEVGFDLLSRLLEWDPEKRITAEQALKHAWFQDSSCK